MVGLNKTRIAGEVYEYLCGKGFVSSPDSQCRRSGERGTRVVRMPELLRSSPGASLHRRIGPGTRRNRSVAPAARVPSSYGASWRRTMSRTSLNSTSITADSCPRRFGCDRHCIGQGKAILREMAKTTVTPQNLLSGFQKILETRHC